MAAFDLALARVRSGTEDLLTPGPINQLARAAGLDFRNTTLTPRNTLRLSVQQIAHGNVACTAVRHLAGEEFTDSAWCQARQRLPLELIAQVHRTLYHREGQVVDVVIFAAGGEPPLDQRGPLGREV